MNFYHVKDHHSASVEIVCDSHACGTIHFWKLSHLIFASAPTVAMCLVTFTSSNTCTTCVVSMYEIFSQLQVLDDSIKLEQSNRKKVQHRRNMYDSADQRIYILGRI
jgi:FPC/CPF motif-containing protein YcgG